MFSALEHWEWISVAFFAYAVTCALALRSLRRSARMWCVILGSVGAMSAAFSVWMRPISILHDWILPAVVLLLAYWTSGLLFRAPSPRVEAFLLEVDRILRIRPTADAAARPAAELLEFAYAAVYALIPIALVIHFLVRPPTAVEPDRFWSVILMTDFLCFGCLPWVQSRPPRSLETGEPWRSSFRRVNQHLVGAMSIRVNTCPSGHAAEALAAALLVSDASAPIVAAMLFAAAAVSAGAVYGRYHYAVDAISGWAVALVVWLVIWR
jgi:hypothetical protein